MSKLLVTGYASIDYPVALTGTVQPDKTTHISHRDAEAWPRVGGSPYYVASAAARSGMEATPLTWVGDDALGQEYLKCCNRSNVSISGVAQLGGQRSPVCVMVHQGDGSTSCLFDPAFSGMEKLSVQQMELIAQSENICITVGPGHLVEDILSLIPNDTALFWVTKNDKRAFPEEVCKRLAQRSSVIFCNHSERSWIENFDTSASVIVETSGATGCKILTSNGEQTVAAIPIEISDPTGAGDTFAGGFIEVFSRTRDPIEAATSGMVCANQLLQHRISEG